MKIPVGELRKHPGMTKEYTWTGILPPVTLAGDTASFPEPVQVQATAVDTGKRIAVEGTVTAKPLLTCGRCLQDYTYPIREHFGGEFAQAGESHGPGPEDEEEQVRLFTGDSIDLAETVLETIALALPMKPVCREHCRGLCPHCGRNLNEEDCDCQEETVDPRMAVLAKLINRE